MYEYDLFQFSVQSGTMSTKSRTRRNSGSTQFNSQLISKNSSNAASKDEAQFFIMIIDNHNNDLTNYNYMLC